MQYKAQGRRAQDCRVLFAWDIIAEDRESSRSMDSIAVNAQKKTADIQQLLLVLQQWS